MQQGRLLAALCCIVRKSHRGSGASERVSEWGSGGRGLCLPRGLQGEARVAVRENSGAVRIDDCARSLHLPSTHTHTHTQHEVRGAGRVTASLRHCLTHSLTCCVVSERMSSVASSCACCCTSLALVSLALVAVLVLVAVAVSEAVRRRAKVGGGHSLQHTSNTGSALTHSLTHTHTHSPTHYYTHTLTHSYTHTLASPHSPTHYYTHSLTHSLTHWAYLRVMRSNCIMRREVSCRVALSHSFTHSLSLSLSLFLGHAGASTRAELTDCAAVVV